MFSVHLSKKNSLQTKNIFFFNSTMCFQCHKYDRYVKNTKRNKPSCSITITKNIFLGVLFLLHVHIFNFQKVHKSITENSKKFYLTITAYY